MKNRIPGLLTVCILLVGVIMSGCSGSTPTPQPVDTPDTSGFCSVGGVDATPVVYGLWMKEEDSNKRTVRELLTVTADSVYLVESTGSNGNGSIRETFFEVSGVDWVNGVITMSAKWVRLNGNYGGFDYPLRYMKIAIDGDSLYYSMGDEGVGIPADATNGPWLRK
jgi:hypothetical protein